MNGSNGNAVSVKVSRCVGCGTPIIGERLRCPACHDEHAATIAVASDSLSSGILGENDATLPRQLSRRASSVREAVVAWIGACLIVLLAAIVLIAAARSCQ